MRQYLGTALLICLMMTFTFFNMFFCVDTVDQTSLVIHPHVVKEIHYSNRYDVTIIIPYMNREQHKRDFIAYMSNYTASRYPNKRILVIISEQGDNELAFSRSWTFNAGYLFYKEHYRSPCVMIHDVDRFPCPDTPTVPYFECDNPMHLSSENRQWKWGVPYEDFVGGVLNMNPTHWEHVNGLHNGYRAWGGEDDDLCWRMKQARLPKLTRPPKGAGRFCDFPRKSKHHSANYSKKHYKANVKILEQTKSDSEFYKTDGLNTFNSTMTRFSIDNMTYDNFHIIQVTHIL